MKVRFHQDLQRGGHRPVLEGGDTEARQVEHERWDLVLRLRASRRAREVEVDCLRIVSFFSHDQR